MSKNEEQIVIKCCVKNCQKEILVEDAIVIEEKYFCGICGVAYARSHLNF